jgi:hypothetical protein
MFGSVPSLYALSRNFEEIKTGFLCQACGDQSSPVWSWLLQSQFIQLCSLVISHLQCGHGYFNRSSSNSVVFPWLFFCGTFGI